MSKLNSFSRRRLIRAGAIGGAGIATLAALAGCGETQIIEKEVVKVVTQEVVVEKIVTQIVEKEKAVEKIVEKIVTQIVEKEKIVEKIVTAAPAKPVETTIVVWNADWGELYNDLMKKIASDFTAKAAPNIKVDYQFIPKWEEKLLTAVAGGDPPDSTYTNWVAQGNLAFQGVFQPLDSYVKAAGLSRDDFLAAMWDSSMMEGRLYAIPGGADLIALFYNRKMYTDAGLDPEKPPLTQDELVEHSMKLLKKEGAKIVQTGWHPLWSNELLAFLSGAKFWDEGLQEVTPEHEGVLNYLSRMGAYAKNVDMNQIAAFWQDQPGYSKPGSPFALGKAAYLSSGFWAQEALDKYAPDVDYAIAMLPSKTGAPEERKWDSVQGWMYSIPTGAKHPEEGWQFMKYAFVDEAALMGWLTLNGPTTHASQEPWKQKMLEIIGPQNRMAKYFDFFTGKMNKGEAHWPAIPVGSFYNEEWGKAHEAVVRGTKEATPAMLELKKIVMSELVKVRRARGKTS